VLKKAFGRPQAACAERRINQLDAYSTRDRTICRSFSTPSLLLVRRYDWCSVKSCCHLSSQRVADAEFLLKRMLRNNSLPTTQRCPRFACIEACDGRAHEEDLGEGESGANPLAAGMDLPGNELVMQTEMKAGLLRAVY